MPQNFTMEFVGLSAVKGALRKFRFTFVKELPGILKEAGEGTFVEAIRDAILSQGIEWRGNLSEAVKVKTEKAGGDVRFSVYIDPEMAPYADYIEHGRDPEEVGTKEALKIYEWVVEKLGLTEPAATIVAIRVVHKIEDEGLMDEHTLPNPFFEHTVESNVPRFTSAVREAVGRLVEDLT